MIWRGPIGCNELFKPFALPSFVRGQNSGFAASKVKLADYGFVHCQISFRTVMGWQISSEMIEDELPN